MLKCPPSLLQFLLSDVQLLDDCAVTLNVYLLEVAEKISSVTDHFEKAATAVMVLVVGLEVLGEGVDAIGKDRDLNLGRTCVALVGLVLVNNGLLYVFLDHDVFHLSLYLRRHSERRVNSLSTVIRIPSQRSSSYYTTIDFNCKDLFENLINYFLKGSPDRATPGRGGNNIRCYLLGLSICPLTKTLLI